jgi:hypothetical protein
MGEFSSKRPIFIGKVTISAKLLRFEKIWCGRVDSNHHGIATASPSSWCVCQFRHDRKKQTETIVSAPEETGKARPKEVHPRLRNLLTASAARQAALSLQAEQLVGCPEPELAARRTAALREQWHPGPGCWSQEPEQPWARAWRLFEGQSRPDRCCDQRAQPWPWRRP